MNKYNFLCVKSEKYHKMNGNYKLNDAKWKYDK